MVHLQALEADNQRLVAELRSLELQTSRLTRELAGQQARAEAQTQQATTVTGDLHAARQV